MTIVRFGRLGTGRENRGLFQVLQHERRAFHARFGLEDQKEGMAAFVEKRKTNFRNR